jgi:hypothetical protein
MTCRFLLTTGIAQLMGAALVAAAQRGHVDVCRVLVSEGPVGEASWARASARDSSEALRGAAAGGHVDVCRVLLFEGPEASRVRMHADAPYRVLLVWARACGYEDV